MTRSLSRSEVAEECHWRCPKGASQTRGGHSVKPGPGCHGHRQPLHRVVSVPGYEELKAQVADVDKDPCQTVIQPCSSPECDQSNTRASGPASSTINRRLYHTPAEARLQLLCGWKWLPCLALQQIKSGKNRHRSRVLVSRQGNPCGFVANALCVRGCGR